MRFLLFLLIFSNLPDTPKVSPVITPTCSVIAAGLQGKKLGYRYKFRNL